MLVYRTLWHSLIYIFTKCVPVAFIIRDFSKVMGRGVLKQYSMQQELRNSSDWQYNGDGNMVQTMTKSKYFAMNY